MPELAPEQKYYRTKNILLIISFIGVMILAFFLFRSCEKEKATSIAYDNIEDSLNSVLDKNDSIEYAASVLASRLKDAETVKQFAIEQMNNYRERLNKTADRAESLAQQVKAAKKDKDTIRYYEKCDSLADENIYLRQIITHNDSLVTNVLIMADQRIKKSDSLSEHWRLAYMDCNRVVESVSSQLPKLEPKGGFLIGVTAIVGPVVGAGPSAAYQDKNGKVFQATVLGTNQKVLYQGTVLVPIGRKK